MGKKIHASWLIGWASLGLLAGTAACLVIDPELFRSIVWPVVAVCLFMISFVGRYGWMAVLVLLAGSMYGLWQGSAVKIQLHEYVPHYGAEVVMTGKVSQDTSVGEKGDQRLYLSHIRIDSASLVGEVWVSTDKADIKRGDIVTLKGKLSEGFGNTPAVMYRAQIVEIQRPYPGDIARRMRDRFAEGIRLAIPEPEVNLGLGYLVGQKTALPPNLEEQIKITGLTHVVVASGYNLTILVMFSRKLFSRVSKFLATLLSSLLVLSFMMVTGFSPSMTRAGLVAGLGLLVWYYGRKMHPFVLLSFAAAVTVMMNPSYVWGDLGWYLSFTAFAGVIVLAPLLQHYFWGSSENVPMLRQLLVDTSAAQILTSPLIFLAFSQYSLYALPANILVLPIVPLAMLCTFIAGFAGLLMPSAASIAGWPATMLLRYSIKIIEYFASLPNAQGELTFNPLLMFASYSGIAAAVIYMKRRTCHDFRNPNEENY